MVRSYERESQDVPGHKYAYTFDLDVMHPFMLRSFEPFFNAGSLLELGSFRGDFTRRLVGRFTDITCVEASAEAVAASRAVLGDGVRFVQGTFETVSLDRTFDNVILTHVLEHLDDPVGVLQLLSRIPFGTAGDTTQRFTYYPDFKTTSAYRSEAEITAQAAMSAHLALKIAYLLRYSNAPVPGFKTTDSTTTASVVLRWKAATAAAAP